MRYERVSHGTLDEDEEGEEGTDSSIGLGESARERIEMSISSFAGVTRGARWPAFAKAFLLEVGALDATTEATCLMLSCLVQALFLETGADKVVDAWEVLFDWSNFLVQARF